MVDVYMFIHQWFYYWVCFRCVCSNILWLLCIHIYNIYIYTYINTAYTCGIMYRHDIYESIQNYAQDGWFVVGFNQKYGATWQLTCSCLFVSQASCNQIWFSHTVTMCHFELRVQLYVFSIQTISHSCEQLYHTHRWYGFSLFDQWPPGRCFGHHGREDGRRTNVETMTVGLAYWTWNNPVSIEKTLQSGFTMAYFCDCWARLWSSNSTLYWYWATCA